MASRRLPRALRERARARGEARRANELRAAASWALEQHGAGGMMYGDTSGFHERDMAAGWRATEGLPIGFRA